MSDFITPTLRIRKSCANLRDKAIALIAKRSSPTAVSCQTHTPPIPGLKRLYLVASKAGQTDYKMTAYRLEFLLTEFAPPSAKTRAEGILCERFSLMGGSVRDTRDADMAAAVYLGQVPKAIGITDLKAKLGNAVDLSNTYQIDEFIKGLWGSRILYSYMDRGCTVNEISATLKVYCDAFVVGHDQQGHPTGFFKLGNGAFLSQFLPILDLCGEELRSKEFCGIPPFASA